MHPHQRDHRIMGVRSSAQLEIIATIAVTAIPAAIMSVEASSRISVTISPTALVNRDGNKVHDAFKMVF